MTNSRLAGSAVDLESLSKKSKIDRDLESCPPRLRDERPFPDAQG